MHQIRDLGLILDQELTFKDHILSICKSADRTLGFIMRTAYNFTDIKVVVMLYNAYVRSKLEFDAIVWDPYEKKYKMIVERIQRRFCRYLYKRTYGYYPFLFPSLFVVGMVSMCTLELRRKLALLVHFIGVLRQQVDNPIVLSGIGLYVPSLYRRALRRRPPLLAAVQRFRTLHGENAPTPRAVALINNLLEAYDHVDIFFDSFYILKDNLILYISNIM